MPSGDFSTDQIASLTPEQQRELVARLLREKIHRSKRFPMSAGQQGLWHAFRRDPAATSFNVFLPTRIRSRILPDVLRRSFDLLSVRHASLRTTFSDAEGELTQQVHDQLPPEFTITPMPGATDEALRATIREQADKAFDLEKGPLLRICLYKIAEDDWLIFAQAHHIVVDFWSLVLILGELRVIYSQLVAGLEANLPPAQNNYAAFVAEQAKLLASDRGEQFRKYWLEQVGKGAGVIEMPADYQRPAVFTARAGTQGLTFGTEVGAKVVQLASRLRVTPNAVVQASLQTLIGRYCDEEQFFIGSPFSGRGSRQYEQTVGFFVNVLPLLADLSGDPTFEQLILRSSETLMSALENEAYPIASIVHDSGLPRDPSRSPLFQVSCTFEKSHVKEEAGRAGFLFPGQKQAWDFGGMRQESFFLPHPTCHYDLEFIFELTGNQLQGMICFCKDLFTHGTASQIAACYSELLDALLAHPQRRISEVGWATSAAKPPAGQASLEVSGHRCSRTVHAQIAEQAVAQPKVVALADSQGSMTYEELMQSAANLAKQLVESELTRGEIVPVCCHLGSDAFLGCLAVQLAGGAAVPVDAHQPSVEADDLCRDATIHHVLTDSDTSWGDAIANRLEITRAGGFPDSGWTGVLPEVLPEDLAYVVFTSGSTGKPKGVLVEHAAVVNTLQWRAKDVPLSSKDRVLVLLSHQFDAALGVVWTALTQGASLVWPPPGTATDVDALIDFIISEKITVLPAVPSLLKLLVRHSRFEQCASLRMIWTGGESMPTELPEEIRKRCNVPFWNFYGPTEAAIEATACELSQHDPRKPVPIGKPITGAEVLLLDPSNRPLPPTVPGQIAIGGKGLARGYLNRPELTQTRFIAHPCGQPGERLYLTGDRGRMTVDGMIEFFGRTDHQVKVRGYRLELGEVEAVAEQHANVYRAAAQLFGDHSDARLVLFVSWASSAIPLATSELRQFLTERLPAYKLPSKIIAIDEMPMLTSGKVDRKRLPEVLPADIPEDYEPPRGPAEEFVHRAWCDILTIDQLSVDRNFFDCGGSSLQAAMLSSRLSEALKIKVPTALVFDLATIRQMTRKLYELDATNMQARFGELVIDAGGQDLAGPAGLLTHFSYNNQKNPIFLVHPPGGIVICYRDLAFELASDCPIVGIRGRGLHGKESLPTSLEAMAEEYVAAIRTSQPRGPYMLGGWSLGGLVAFEMAQQLVASGDEVAQLILLDTTIPQDASELVPADQRVNVGLEYGIEMTLEELGELPPEEQLPFLWEHAQKLGVLNDDASPEVVAQALEDLQELFHCHIELATRYRMQPLDVDVLLVRPRDTPFDVTIAHDRGWSHLVRSVTVDIVPGHHHSMVQPPNVEALAASIRQSLAANAVPANQD